jgi:hypothetical protein
MYFPFRVFSRPFVAKIFLPVYNFVFLHYDKINFIRGLGRFD